MRYLNIIKSQKLKFAETKTEKKKHCKQVPMVEYK